MAESFLFNTAEKLLGKLGSLAYQEVCLAWGVKSDLKKLKDVLSTIKAVLLDAEEKQAKNHQLRDWLGKLKDVMNDAEDVLDEFECEALRRQVVKTHGSVSRKVRRFFSHSNPLVFQFEIGHAIKQVRERLDEIASHRTQFHLSERLLEDRSVVPRKKEMSYSFVKASDVIGRDSEKEDIVASLFRPDDDDRNVSVIPIVGIGGLGKTTLAKSVFNDERVDESFQLMIWVCVSEDFDLKQLIVKIIESATEQNHNDLNLEQLQIRLRRILDGKKFLLVLDDVWNDNRGKWIELRNLLMVGANGSKIIVTTRSPVIASMMGTVRAYDLEKLSHEHCMSLFLKWAFDEGEEKRHANLVKIGDAIVKKCKGVPLAVRTLGSLLYSKTDQIDWLFVRDSEIWEFKQKETDILPALQLSYNQMPSYLKQCFAFFSLFPKDYQYNNLELIQLWMAHGLLQLDNQNQELEDVGNQYIYELYSRSCLQDYIDFGHARFFGIHDLTHDLALFVAQSEYLVVNSRTQNVSEKVRHLSFSEATSTWQERDVLELLQKSKSVRTISLRIKGQTSISNSLMDSCVSRFKYLRVLNLSESSFEMLPNSIGNLTHLRSLDLSKNRRIKKVPNSICKLQNLQSLQLNECEELQDLPRDIRNMISLRFFEVTTKQTCLPENGIGCLSSLQNLSFDKCDNLVSLFEGMQRLTGLRTLLIVECGSLISLPRGMKYLTALKVLMIHGCEKLDVMDTEDNHDWKLNLQTVMLIGLPKLVSLPHWLQRFANTLQHLVIGDCPNFAALPKWLPNLTSLRKFRIENCQKLSSLPKGMHCLTSLRELWLNECPKLSRRCEPKSGKDWFKIARVPDIYLDSENVKSTTWAHSRDH